MTGTAAAAATVREVAAENLLELGSQRDRADEPAFFSRRYACGRNVTRLPIEAEVGRRQPRDLGGPATRQEAYRHQLEREVTCDGFSALRAGW